MKCLSHLIKFRTIECASQFPRFPQFSPTSVVYYANASSEAGRGEQLRTGKGKRDGAGKETSVGFVELQIYHHLISIWRRAVLMTLLTTLKSSSRGGRADKETGRQSDRQPGRWAGGIAVILLAALCIFPLHCSVSSFAICRMPHATCCLLLAVCFDAP